MRCLDIVEDRKCSESRSWHFTAPILFALFRARHRPEVRAVRRRFESTCFMEGIFNSKCRETVSLAEVLLKQLLLHSSWPAGLGLSLAAPASSFFPWVKNGGHLSPIVENPGLHQRRRAAVRAGVRADPPPSAQAAKYTTDLERSRGGSKTPPSPVVE
jgi:hypothetical protein